MEQTHQQFDVHRIMNPQLRIPKLVIKTPIIPASTTPIPSTSTQQPRRHIPILPSPVNTKQRYRTKKRRSPSEERDPDYKTYTRKQPRPKKRHQHDQRERDNSEERPLVIDEQKPQNSLDDLAKAVAAVTGQAEASTSTTATTAAEPAIANLALLSRVDDKAAAQHATNETQGRTAMREATRTTPQATETPKGHSIQEILDGTRKINKVPPPYPATEPSYNESIEYHEREFQPGETYVQILHFQFLLMELPRDTPNHFESARVVFRSPQPVSDILDRLQNGNLRLRRRAVIAYETRLMESPDKMIRLMELNGLMNPTTATINCTVLNDSGQYIPVEAARLRKYSICFGRDDRHRRSTMWIRIYVEGKRFYVHPANYLDAAQKIMRHHAANQATARHAFALYLGGHITGARGRVYPTGTYLDAPPEDEDFVYDLSDNGPHPHTPYKPLIHHSQYQFLIANYGPGRTYDSLHPR